MNKAIIFSAPSGSGKTTLVKHCLKEFPELEFSVSCTTRHPRGTEKDGVDYYFISVEDFKHKIEQNAFVEYEEVYQNLFYGTLKSEVEKIWAKNKTVIFDVDVKGGVKLKHYFGDKALSVFIKPPSIEELEKRLLARKTDSLETIKTRIEKAKQELEYEKDFDVVVVNNNLETAEKELDTLLKNFINN